MCVLPVRTYPSAGGIGQARQDPLACGITEITTRKFPAMQIARQIAASYHSLRWRLLADQPRNFPRPGAWMDSAPRPRELATPPIQAFNFVSRQSLWIRSIPCIQRTRCRANSSAVHFSLINGTPASPPIAFFGLLHEDGRWLLDLIGAVALGHERTYQRPRRGYRP